MKTLFAILFCFVSSAAFAQANCLQTAKEVQPQLSAETRREFETKLNEARELFDKESLPDRVIWLGRRTAYLGRYKDAIAIFSEGIKQIPADAKLIPGHGPLATIDDLKTYHQTLVETSTLVQAEMKKGRSLEEIKKAGLPEKYKEWGSGFIKTDFWIETVHRSYSLK